MAFEKICSVSDVDEGEMDAFDTNSGLEVLILHLTGGEMKAYQAICPHEAIDLVEGEFDGTKLTCSAHLWQFDGNTGKGINPDDCAIAEYPLKIDGSDVLVDIEGIEPLQSHG